MQHIFITANTNDKAQRYNNSWSVYNVRDCVTAFTAGSDLMLPLTANHAIHLCCTPVDMRNNFDGLCAIVKNHFRKDPLKDGVFVFVNKPRDKMKLLFWDRHGYWLLYKRLEAGVFQMPSSDTHTHAPESLQITYEQLILIIEGIDLASVKRRKRYCLQHDNS